LNKIKIRVSYTFDNKLDIIPKKNKLDILF